MNKQVIIFEGKEISFSDEGKGNCLVLLHGFTESMDIWEDFSGVLKEDYRVLCVDLPGHGKSACIGEGHSMERMAEVVKYVLESRNITKLSLIHI
jgi:pimeloyl-ACP methyl ester carboxylesterase